MSRNPNDNPGGGKVVSLEQRRARRHGRTERPGAEAPVGEPPQPAPPEAGSREPVPGRLIWLHCPTCDTVEYTELDMPGGRRHKCGTAVEEVAVEIDVRAEATMAAINLQRIDTILQYLGQQRERFAEYQERLRLIAGQAVDPYPVEEGMLSELPVAEIDALGLLISRALHEPARRFAPEPEPGGEPAAERAAEPPGDGGPPEDGEG